MTAEQRLKVLLPQAPASNLDESGGRVAGKLHWVHVVSTPGLTFYGVHPQRGHEALPLTGMDPLILMKMDPSGERCVQRCFLSKQGDFEGSEQEDPNGTEGWRPGQPRRDRR